MSKSTKREIKKITRKVCGLLSVGSLIGLTTSLVSLSLDSRDSTSKSSTAEAQKTQDSKKYDDKSPKDIERFAKMEKPEFEIRDLLKKNKEALEEGGKLLKNPKRERETKNNSKLLYKYFGIWFGKRVVIKYFKNLKTVDVPRKVSKKEKTTKTKKRGSKKSGYSSEMQDKRLAESKKLLEEIDELLNQKIE